MSKSLQPSLHLIAMLIFHRFAYFFNKNNGWVRILIVYSDLQLLLFLLVTAVHGRGLWYIIVCIKCSAIFVHFCCCSGTIEHCSVSLILLLLRFQHYTLASLDIANLKFHPVAGRIISVVTNQSRANTVNLKYAMQCLMDEFISI